ncbi:RagB/SusD family nutrient uptake outer membrane protein [Chitinophaga barathri]|uniref:RagB/SusD family nutrient uptake outer membrane protein n=1 Tax=Chitinophaga barathri TaxID=1647451 RepID=A0A3N4M4R3_9BACT|nr:RagB/SusD family nutrient uptake outer membrane protein [Chitinophaga barathri]RPD38131.1 RagB/SusD family nutrient uptake outer membrane protein [Chitinophaga barathri]
MKSIQFLIISAAVLFTSCSKFVDTPTPKTELASQLVFTDDKTASAAVVGLYVDMNGFNYQFANSLINYLSAIHADDLYYFTTFENYDVFRQVRLLPNSNYVTAYWSSVYSYIYHTNACIEGLTTAQNLTPSVKDQLLGESYFMRAFFYFYLVNIYGDVPLITTTDYVTNDSKGREPALNVYTQIISDLREAKARMADNYPSSNRVRPNKAAATALLARTFLYTKDWAKAETEATEVLNNSRYTLLQDLNSVFLANSREAIWQLQAVNVAGGRNTWEGFTVVPFSDVSTVTFRLDTTNLVGKFEPNDARRTNWTGNRFLATGAHIYWPMKYKVRTSTAAAPTEYSMVMRLAEQFLIRAEARIRQDKLNEGRSDLDSIRLRAKLPVLSTSLDKSALLLAVEKERQVELFTEWGHRWFDLKRTQRSSAVLSPIKGANWQATDTLYPIPTDAIKTNINLTQNEGYK